MLQRAQVVTCSKPAKHTALDTCVSLPTSWQTPCCKDTNAHSLSRTHSFVISYFLSDDTLSVFEPPRRNSGLPGGAFAERGRVRRPGGGGALDCYTPADMRVRHWATTCYGHHLPVVLLVRGARKHRVPLSPALAYTSPHALKKQIGPKLLVNGRAFLLDDADEATLKATAA